MAWSDTFACPIALGVALAQPERELLNRRFDEGGPVLLGVKIDDKPGPIQTPRDPTLIRHQFMKGLGTSRGGALDG